MKIQVTEQHILEGHHGSGYYCPIAVALIKAFPGANISVLPSCVSIFYNRKNYFNLKLSQEMTDKINHYDTVGEMKPFELEIEYENQCQPATH